MTFAETVASDIGSIGGSATISVAAVTETEDTYGNVSNSFASSVSYTAVVSRVPHKEVLERFGEVPGQYIKIHLPATASIKERDRVVYQSHNWKVIDVTYVYYESALSGLVAFAHREVSDG